MFELYHGKKFITRFHQTDYFKIEFDVKRLIKNYNKYHGENISLKNCQLFLKETVTEIDITTFEYNTIPILAVFELDEILNLLKI